MKSAVALHRPALLVAAVCVGLALSIWASVPLAAAAALALCALGGVLLLDGVARLAVLGVALAALGLGWGSLRMDALRSSVLVGELGETRRCGARHRRTRALVRVVDASDRRDASVPARGDPRARAPRPSSRPLASARSHPRGIRPDRGATARAGRLRRASLARAPGNPGRARGVELARGREARRDQRLRRCSSRPDRAGSDARVRRHPSRDRARCRARRGREPPVRRAGRLPGLRSVSPPGRLGAECGLPRRGYLRAGLVAAALETRPGGVDPRDDRRVRAGRRVAALGRAGRCRRRTRIPRLARGPSHRSLALPGARSVRADGMDADVASRAGVPAVVRGSRGDLRGGAARATAPRRLSGSDRSRGRGLGRARMRCRDGADRPLSTSARPRSTRSRQTSSPSSPLRWSSGSGFSRPSSIPCRPARLQVWPLWRDGPRPGSS